MSLRFLSLHDFKELTKVRLSVSVVFSSVSGYLLAADSISVKTILLVSLGGYCMVGASNVFNQIIEKDLDVLMVRTRNRPIPAGRVSTRQAFVLGASMTLLGLIALYAINSNTAAFASIGTFVYVCMYTPLKIKTPLSVFVGAISGAIPFMLGWVAASSRFGIEPGVLFMIQFFWQFPHFWAIAWMLDEDYKKAGFKMLPTGKKDKSTVMQILSYTIWTMLIALFPVTGFSGRLSLSVFSAVLITLVGFVMLFFGLRLYAKRDQKTAGQLVLMSVVYITVLQIVYVVDKLVLG